MPTGRAAAVGCRAHTGWAALVVVAGGLEQPEVLLRVRAELADPAGRVWKNVYQASRSLEPAEAAVQVAAAERVARVQAAAALERVSRSASGGGADVQACAVVTGSLAGEASLESILASHALAHAAEGRLYQRALLEGAESFGLDPLPVPKRSIWDQGESAFGLHADELRQRIDDLRSEVGPPWAEDQKLAALAAWVALAARATVPVQ